MQVSPGAADLPLGPALAPSKSQSTREALYASPCLPSSGGPGYPAAQGSSREGLLAQASGAQGQEQRDRGSSSPGTREGKLSAATNFLHITPVVWEQGTCFPRTLPGGGKSTDRESGDSDFSFRTGRWRGGSLEVQKCGFTCWLRGLFGSSYLTPQSCLPQL